MLDIAETAAPASSFNAAAVDDRSDAELDGVIDLRYPLIPGHEPVGVIDEIGADAAARWGVKVGDRVAVEPFLPCGGCRSCLSGAYEHCNGWAQMMFGQPCSIMSTISAVRYHPSPA